MNEKLFLRPFYRKIVHFIPILIIGILSTTLLISSSFAQSPLESNQDVYIFVQTFLRNSDGVLIHYFENDKFTDKNLAALDVFLDLEASRGNAPVYDMEGKKFQLIQRSKVLEIDSFQLVASTKLEESIKFPEQTFSTNVDGTENVLNSCVRHNIKNIVAASSAAVYGETQNIPISENNKTNPSSPYGESKLKMEEYIQSFSKKHNLNSIILRIFNVYGPGQSPEYAGVITKFLEKISKNEALEIFGDGLQTRDFVSVQDVIESIFCAISKIEGRQGTIFNIGSGKWKRMGWGCKKDAS